MKLLTDQEAKQISDAVEAWLDTSTNAFGSVRSLALAAVMEYVANLNHKTCFEYLDDKSTEEQPYIGGLFIPAPVEVKEYNPNYGDDRVCKCGHTYYRHFDSYENMEPVGCKYCGCFTFEEATPDNIDLENDDVW